MEIIIEGCDGVGKTTLVNKLKKHYQIDSMHITSKDPNDYSFYKQLLKKKDIIYDRHFIGEMIYPKIFNRKQKLSNRKFEKLLKYCRKHNIKIIILTTGDSIISQRLYERGNEHTKILENIHDINLQFRDIANKYNIEIIDTLEVNTKAIYKWLENKL